jgi:enolase
MLLPAGRRTGKPGNRPNQRHGEAGGTTDVPLTGRDFQPFRRRGIMPGFEIAELSALEILDSRAKPTVAVTLRLGDGTAARAGVPSGASTGSREAVERRDGDQARYEGKGVLGAVAAVNTELADLLRGQQWQSLEAVDQAMIGLDGTPTKSRLGANAIVGVSMALARALASSAGVPPWRWLTPDGVPPCLPVPHFNVLNGGAHAPNELDFQEFMIAPLGAPSMPEAVRAGAEVYVALRRELSDRKLSTGLGDEGGFAPEIAEPEEVLRLLVKAITDAGYRPGRDGVAIALDPAASEFRRPDGRYHVGHDVLTSTDMIERYARMTTDFPVYSIEDGLGEDDDEGWIALTARLGATVQLVGDDNFVTNPAIITEAIKRGICNAALIKLNQIGSVTETQQAMAICRTAGYAAMVSHRSGETEDSFIADLATGSGCGQLKSGAPARGERVAKYNRLLEIAAATPGLPYGKP